MSGWLEKFSERPMDLLVIGGGIVGSGVARDAAMRGLRVGLVDKYDFAFGTSSRSSRLLHGGLRYLAQGRIGLVREASREKMILHRIAPHLADPLPFIFPTRRGTEWWYWKMRMGVKVYDLLCGGRNLGKSRGLSYEDVLVALPGINRADLTGAVRYYDGLTNDARLVIDTLRSAESAGAVLANYVSAESPRHEAGMWSVVLEDHTTGACVEAKAKCVVNAAGPWGGGFAPAQVKLRLTKGVHLVVDREKLNTPDAVVLAKGSRILFVIPWGERAILGTTDTDYDGPTESPTVGMEDVRYILDVVNENFPEARIGDEDVISAWAGLRPLIADPKGRPSDISRAHEIHETQSGWFDVAGGKLTTYRLMAEQTVDRVIERGGFSARACETAEKELLPEAERRFSGILPPAFGRQAVEQAVRKEWAVHLDDVMIRRTSWRYYLKDAGELAPEVARWMGEMLGWDGAKAAGELSAYEQLCAR